MATRARIMIVEDEGIVAMDIQKSLESLGYHHAEVAFSGEEAVSKAMEFCPDLVLMDIRLGEGMDGVESALLIGETRDVPVVYLTAYTDEETLERAKMSQPFGYLVKPFAPNELQTTIEMALHKHFMELQLKERERELSDTVRTLSEAQQTQKMDAMGRLAGGIAHDFNNQLSVILGMGEMLATELRNDPERQELLSEITKACRNAVGLTKQLQAFARRESFKLKPVDLNESVREVERILRRVWTGDITLRTRLANIPGPILADRGCLEQAVLNLALNARESMPHGGNLSFTTSLEELDDPSLPFLFPLVEGHYAMLRVGDSGHGIAPDVLPHIFEPFFTTKSRGRGTGLGLATVHGLMKHVGGNILVYSEPGQGSAFFLYFPLPRRGA